MRRVITHGLLTLMVFFILYSCEGEDQTDQEADCATVQPILIENEVIAPINGTSYFVGLSFDSIIADIDKVTVQGRTSGNNRPFTLDLQNYSLDQEYQQLRSFPRGIVRYLGEIYTTDYLSNGQATFPIQPGGALEIFDYNESCNLLTGSVYVQAYTFSNTLGELRFSIALDFIDIPVDGQRYDL